MTTAEARAAGLLDGMKPSKVRTTRTSAPRRDGTDTRCVTCDMVFTTIAAEDRHVVETRHARYEVVL
jgi:uncharacterized C2H2 Zn-finger protein